MNTRITEVLFLTAIANLGWVSDLAAQITPVTPNTAVAYQGRLSGGAAPASGVYDFQFRIFNANGIFPIAGPLTITNVPVSNGLFTAHLDFDPAVWASPGNNARLLEVAVRSAGGGDFTTLSPRHPITPAPFALKTLGISGNALNAADGSPANAVFVDDTGNVGIGTGDPQSRLHVTGGMAVFDSPGGAIRVTKTAGQLSSDDLGIWNRGGNGGQPFAIADWDTGSKGIFVNTASGNVGIGTGNPQYTLDVAGPVRIARFGDGAEILNLSTERSWAFRQFGSGASTALELVSIGGGGGKNFVINTVGFVGIGTRVPGFNLHVNGTAGKPGGGSWAVASDERLKKNVRPLTGALDKLLGLHGVNFEYIDPAKIHELSGERMGLVAQEVEKVFPDWVETGADGFKRVTVRGLEALVVEALRELQHKQDVRSESLAAELKRRDADNADLRRDVEELKAMVEALARGRNGEKR